MDLSHLNCTLLDNLFNNQNNSSTISTTYSATSLSKGNANAVSDMALTVGNVFLN